MWGCVGEWRENRNHQGYEICIWTPEWRYVIFVERRSSVLGSVKTSGLKLFSCLRLIPMDSGTPGPRKSFNITVFIKWMCIGLSLTAVSVALLVYVTEPWSEPTNILITNITEKSATISWVTSEKTRGYVLYDTEDRFSPGILGKSTNQYDYDDRDVAAEELLLAREESEGEITADEGKTRLGITGRYYVHHVTLENLDPETTYNFRVGNGMRFREGMSGETSFRTFAINDELLVPNPAYGLIKIWGDAGEPLSDGIVYLKITLDGLDSGYVSSSLSENGSWYLDLNNIRDANGDHVIPSLDTVRQKNILEKIEVQAGPHGKYSKIIDVDSDAPANTIYVSDPEIELNQPGVTFQKNDFSRIEPSSLVSYVMAGDCADPRNPINCSVCKPELNCEKGCTYGANGEEVACGYMQYCQERHCSAEEEDPSCECGCQANTKVCSIGEKCQDHRCILDNAAPQEGGAPGIPGDEQGGANCSPDDQHYLGSSCGNGGSCICTTQAVGSSCSVGGMSGTIKQGLCLGSAMVRCCQPSDTDPGTDDPPSGGCGRERCGPMTASCYTSGPNGGWDSSCTWAYCNPNTGGWENVSDCCRSYGGQGCDDGKGGPCDGYDDEYYPEEFCRNGQGDISCTACEDQEACCEKCVRDVYREAGQYCTTNVRNCHNHGKCGGEDTVGAGEPKSFCKPAGYYDSQASCEQMCSDCGWIGYGMYDKCYTCKVPIQDQTCEKEGEYRDGHICTNSWFSGRTWRKVIELGEQCPEDHDDDCICVDDTHGRKFLIPTGGFCCGESGNDCGGGDLAGAEPVNAGDKCTNDTCFCSTVVNKKVSNGECCPAKTGKLEGDYCDKGCSQRYDSSQGTCVPSEKYSEPEEQTTPAPPEGSPSETPTPEPTPEPTPPQDSLGMCTCTGVCDRTGCGDAPILGEQCGTGYGDPFSVSVQIPKDECTDSFCSSKLKEKAVAECKIDSRCAKINGCTVSSSSWAPVSEAFQIGIEKEQENIAQSGRSVSSSIVRMTALAADTESVIFSPEEQLYVFSEGGIYHVEVDGMEYYFFVPEGTDSADYVLYVDTNNNNEFDGSDLVVNEELYEVSVEKIANSFTYRIVAGLNFFSFPFIWSSEGEDSGKSMASDLLLALYNSYGDSFYSIAKFDNSIGRWNVMGICEGEVYGAEDFKIIPGAGYVLKSKDSMIIELTGKAVTSPVPVHLSEGWNLIGVQGTDTDYTAESLLDAIDSSGNLDADNVTEWNPKTFRYSGLEKEAGEVYGFDFPVNDRIGYFVRLVDGNEVWTPE